MKNLCFTFLALLPTLAAAEPAFHCVEENSAQPYVANFSRPQNHADLRRQVAGGFRNLAFMSCKYVPVKSEPQPGLQAYLVCAENEDDDRRGYSVKLYANTNPTKGDVFLDGVAKAAMICTR